MAIDARTLAARLYPYLLVLPFALTAFAPPSLNAGIVTSCGLLLGGALCLAGAVGRARPVSRGTAVAVGVSIATAAWFTLATLWAANPPVSLFATHGAATWTMLAVWLCAGVLAADSRTLRETLATVTASGVFFAAAALLEAISRGLERTGRGYAAGFFENSASAGELFAVAIVAAITGALISRTRTWRVAYGLAALISGIGLVVSSSRTAVLGLVVAGIFAVCVALLPRTRVWAWALAATPPTIAVALTGLAVMASGGVLGASAKQFISVVGTDRDGIWRAAWTQFTQTPLLGKGLAQFEAFIWWSGLATGQLSEYVTADPHNTLLAAGIGGGVIGLLLVLAGIFTMLFELACSARRGTRSYGASLLASLPVLVLGMGLVGWVAAAPLLVASALIGAYLGTASPKSGTDPPQMPTASQVRVAGLAVGAISLVLAFAYIQPVSVEYTYARSLQAGGAALSSADAMALYERFPLSGLAEGALAELTPALRAGSSDAKQQAQAIIASTQPGMTRSVTLALRAMVAAQAMSSNDPTGFPLFEKAALAGTQADPASGLWYAFAAMEAKRLGLNEAAASYAEKALRLRQDEATLALLETLKAR